jgi:hypothetical protein
MARNLRSGIAGNRNPLIGHIHVPKCAGTSVRLMLNDVYREAHLPLYFVPGTGRHLPTTYVFPEAEVIDLLGPHSVKAFSSHFVRRFPESISGRPVYYVTFLRDPLQQFVSYLGFARQVYREIQDPVLLSHLPPEMPELCLRDCARWLMQHGTGSFLNFRENYTTNFFARYEVQSSYGFGYSDRRYRAMRLRVAKSVLRRFFFVGISEQMEESWRLLHCRLTNLGLAIPEAPVRRENISDKRDEDLSWLNGKDEVGRRVLMSLREDRQLFRWARVRFLAQVAEERNGRPVRWWTRLLMQMQ